MPQPGRTQKRTAVVTGARGVGTLENADASEARYVDKIVVPEGTRVFRSRYRFLRVQVTQPSHTVNPATGEVTQNAGKAAQFEEYLYKTDDPQIITKLLKLADDPKHGRNFWPLEKEIAEENARREREARRWLSENQELASRILSDLQGKDWAQTEAAE